jgi:hypothetical protein
VLDHFSATDGEQLASQQLHDAAVRHDAIDTEYALVLGFTFGIIRDDIPLLSKMLSEAWHHSHEDIVSALARFRSTATIDALYHATQWTPEYLGFDDARALATKAIWGLGGIPGPEADAALTRLLHDADDIVREGAQEQLDIRADEAEPDS